MGHHLQEGIMTVSTFLQNLLYLPSDSHGVYLVYFKKVMTLLVYRPIVVQQMCVF